MNGRAASAGDVTHDLVTWHWVAAACHARKHALQANYIDRIGGGGVWQDAAEIGENLLAFSGMRKLADHLADRKIAAAEVDEKIIVCLISQRARQVFVIQFTDAQALDLTLDNGASLR